MPTVGWNREEWSGRYEWPLGGDEWSQGWGGPLAQWLTTVWPRLSAFLPTSSVLEIAPGFGRWTQFLLPQCDAYVGVDLSSRCVEACKQRFSDYPKARFFTNDGASLGIVPDSSIDLGFSFDALVHVETDVIDGYLGELSRVLTPDGIAVLHHSNLKAYRVNLFFRRVFDGAAKVVPGLSLLRHRLFGWHQNRGTSVHADSFRMACESAGLSCVGQELVNWGTSRSRLIDCISIVTRPGSIWDRPMVRRENPEFMASAKSSVVTAETYLSLRPFSLDDSSLERRVLR